MIDIFVMCDYRIQRFYFLNFERHAVLLSVISSKFEKYSIFQHQIGKHAIVKQHPAGKLAKKTLSLDEEVNYFYFANGNSTL